MRQDTSSLSQNNAVEELIKEIINSKQVASALRV